MKDPLSRLMDIIDSQLQPESEVNENLDSGNLSPKQARKLYDKFGDPIVQEPEEVSENERIE